MRVSRWLGALWLRGCCSCLFPLPFSFVSVVELVDTPHLKCGARVSVWVRVPPEALAPLESGGALTRPVWWNGRHARLKSGCPVGRASSSLATGTGGTKLLNMGV